MVRSWGRGGSGEKLGRGEGEASREEGGTYWRLVGSTLIAIHDGGRWHLLVVAVRGGTRPRRLVIVIRLLTSFVAVHRPPLSVTRSCPSSCLVSLPCVWSWVTWRVLAVERSCAVDASGVA